MNIAFLAKLGCTLHVSMDISRCTPENHLETTILFVADDKSIIDIEDINIGFIVVATTMT